MRRRLFPVLALSALAFPGHRPRVRAEVGGEHLRGLGDAGLPGRARAELLGPADTAWYSQIALIVAGHVVAVYLAHATALRLFESYRRALWSQVPMLVLMVLYTVSSLWLLSQPIAG